MNRGFWLGVPLLTAILLLVGALSLLPRHFAEKLERALSETMVSGLAPKQMAPREVAEALLAEFKSKRPEFSNVEMHFFEYSPTRPRMMLQESVVYGLQGLSFGEAMRKVATQSGTLFIEKPDAVYFYRPPRCSRAGDEPVPPLTDREKSLADLQRRVWGWTHWFARP